MIRLEKVTRSPETGELLAIYHGEHNTTGREGTNLEFEIRVQRSLSKKFFATVVFDGCAGDDAIAAVQRLGQWCERVSQAVEKAQLSVPSLPLGDVDAR